jgi:DNA-binding NarL/FixJ family response regulator
VNGPAHHFLPDPGRAYLVGPDERFRAVVRTALRRAGVDVGDDPAAAAVVVAAAPTVEAALASRPVPGDPDGYPMLVIAETFSPGEVLAAVRSGARAMLRAADLTSTQVVAALHAARHGDGRIPHEVLIRLLSPAAALPPAGPARPAASTTRVTPKQRVVLRMMAEGHGNAAIARALSWSEHTVKNVIHEVMARMHVRNRAHAVAYAVRSGII